MSFFRHGSCSVFRTWLLYCLDNEDGDSVSNNVMKLGVFKMNVAKAVLPPGINTHN